MRWILWVLGTIVVLAAAAGGWYWLVARLDPDPASVRIETADLTRFLAVLDSLPRARTAGDSARVLEQRYLAPGTPGLEAFLKSRIGSAELLQRQIASHHEYYAHLARSLAGAAAYEPEIRRAFGRLKELYPAARYADVFLVVGRMNSGGTTAPGKLLIGAEMYGRDDAAPTHELSEWERMVLRDARLIPTIVTHEMIHLLQRHRWKTNLLQQALREGGADFVAELVTGMNINSHVHDWAAAREAALWARFTRVMHGEDYGSWFGRPLEEQPADLGYYIGYRIAQAYYDRAADKQAAVADIIRVGDAETFLAASGYQPGRLVPRSSD